MSAIPARHHDVKVISGLDLTVEAGTLLSILGPSGCGKSTFLRVVADLLEPLAGTINVLGRDTARGALAPRRRFRLPGFDTCCRGARCATISACRSSSASAA